MPRKLKRIQRLVSLSSDPESATEDPSLSGGLVESGVTESDAPSGGGTEILVSGSGGQEEEEEEEEEDEESLNGYGTESDNDEEVGWGGTPGSSGIVRDRLSWQEVQRFQHASMSKNAIQREIASILRQDLNITGWKTAARIVHARKPKVPEVGDWKFKNVLYCL